MGSTAAIQQVAQIIQNYHTQNDKLVVVCSAMSGITNQLLAIGQDAEQSQLKQALQSYKDLRQRHLATARELDIETAFSQHSLALFQELEQLIQGIGLIRELSSRSNAYLLSFGEKLSTRLLLCLLHKQGLQASQFDTTFIKTQGTNYEEDEINWSATKNLLSAQLSPSLQQDHICILTGFFGTNQLGYITLLGRGGSDFSGAIAAVSLGIPHLEIWTDVDGFLSADPRIVADAQIIHEIGIQEASELCFFGAKVLHPKTIRPVIDKAGEVWIKNTFKPNTRGTKITQNACQHQGSDVISISSKKVGLISLDLFATQSKKKGILAQLFHWANTANIDIDMIAASEAEISFCIEERFLKQSDYTTALADICPFYIKNDRSVICIVSPKEVKGQIGVAAKIFSAISDSGVSIDMYSQNASEIAQLVVVHSQHVSSVIRSIHTQLVSSKIPVC